MRLLLTGSNGFVGKSLLQAMSALSYEIVCPARNPLDLSGFNNDLIQPCLIGNINRNTDWSQALLNVDTVVHCAGRAHVMEENLKDSLPLYREVNVDGTLRLAQQAVNFGVKRFVFLSSIKVNGEQTSPGIPFTETSTPAPQDNYGRSKLEGELALFEIASNSNMEVVVIRPPLIYGSGIKGNFLNLIKLVQRNIPLPLGSVNNKRSFVALQNLVSLVLLCADRTRSPLAANQVFLVSDNHDISTTTLLRLIADVGGYKIRLVPFPSELLYLFATLIGQSSVAQKVLGDLQVDISKTRNLLGWSPVVNMEQQLLTMFDDFINL